MKNNGNSIFKTVIFFLGLFLLLFALGYFLFKPDKDMWAALLISVSAVIIYVAFFIPAFFLPENKDKTGRIFVGGVVYYRGYFLYAIVSIAVSVMLWAEMLRIVPALILQAAILLVFLIYIFVACTTAEHIMNVDTAEQQKIYGVQSLRSQAGMLVGMGSQLGMEHNDLRQMMQQISEDMRYLSPSDSPDAMRLENQMLGLLQDISRDPFFANSANVSKSGVMEKMKRFEILYQQRKAIY